MKKKMLAAVFSALLIFTMSVSLFACGGNGNEDNGDNEKPATYSVTYQKSEAGEVGTLPTDETKYQAGAKVTLKSPMLALEGYIFMGWNDGTDTYLPSQEYTMPAKDVTFTAVWSESYLMLYLAKPSDRVGVNYYLTEGQQHTLIEKPASFQDENNREFVGWTLRDEEVFFEPGQTFTMPAKFVIFVAKWKATSIDVVYYDDTTAESEVYAKQNYGFDDSVVLPEPPQKKGFTFGGWGTYLSTEANFTSDYVFTQSDKEAGKIEVFALWIPNDDGDEETPA